MKPQATGKPAVALGGGALDTDLTPMRVALELAERAGHAGEVPVGAVVVVGSVVVGRGHNQPITSGDPSAHAEIVALRDAARTLGNYRLNGATLYSTVEPCLMCFGALVHARIERLVYGASDGKVGMAGRFERLRLEGAVFNHRFDVRGGVLAAESTALVQSFFLARRNSPDFGMD